MQLQASLKTHCQLCSCSQNISFLNQCPPVCAGQLIIILQTVLQLAASTASDGLKNCQTIVHNCSKPRRSIAKNVPPIDQRPGSTWMLWGSGFESGSPKVVSAEIGSENRSQPRNCPRLFNCFLMRGCTGSRLDHGLESLPETLRQQLTWSQLSKWSTAGPNGRTATHHLN